MHSQTEQDTEQRMPAHLILTFGEMCKKLGITEVPCVRLDHLTDKQRREYAIMHNKTSELAEYDFDNLKIEMQELSFDDFEIDFGVSWDDDVEDDEEEENPYSMNVSAPIYEIKGECPDIKECVSTKKTNELIKEINNADIPSDIKKFLKYASYRHLKFNYKNIAEFYAHADKKIQDLFEKNALVIIDFDKAIQNGFTKLSKDIENLREEDSQ